MEPPPPGGAPGITFDQFGQWAFTALEPVWLAVPSLKLIAIGVEEQTWGQVKALYKDRATPRR